MSTIRVSNIQHGSAGSAAITLNSDGQATLNGLNFPTAGPLSNRNLIINGAMQVAQRGTSQASLTDSPAFVVDRFAYRRGGAWGTNSFTMSQQSSGAPGGFTHFLRLAQSGTAAAPPTNTFCALATYLEGNTVYQAGFGTSAAQPLTLSFWAKASQAGTYCVRLSNASNQAFVYEYSVTSTWQRFTVPIPARTAGTWGTGNNGSFYLEWVVAADSDGTFSGSTGWTETDARHTTNQLETFASTAGATFDLTGVQLEVGSVATPFEHRSYGDELRRCQRYFFNIPPGVADNLAFPGFAASTTLSIILVVYPEYMRAAPTLNSSGNWEVIDGGQRSVTSFSTQEASVRSLRLNANASGLTQSEGNILRNNNDATATLEFSAEL